MMMVVRDVKCVDVLIPTLRGRGGEDETSRTNKRGRNYTEGDRTQLHEIRVNQQQEGGKYLQ